MTAPLVVKTLLDAHAPLTAVVSTRIYPTELPEEIALPALVFEQVDSYLEPPFDAGAGVDLKRARVQVTAYAVTYEQVKTTLALVRAALAYKSGTVAGVTVVGVVEDGDGPDVYDAELRVHGQSVDWRVVFYQ